MSFLLAIFLGIVQGLTEFLPVSSSGHLVLLQRVFEVGETPIFFDTVVHLGTLLAVLLFFGRDLVKVVRGAGVLRNIVVGTMPVVLVGLVVQQFLVEKIFGNLFLVGLGFLVTAGLLFWSKKLAVGQGKIKNFTDLQALVIGCFQAVAVLPGISRSGATIVGGLSQKLDRESAFKFSFYLSIPAVIGANLLQIKDLADVDFLPQGLLGMAVAFVVGYFSLGLLRRALLTEKFHYFSAYCSLLGVISLGVALAVYFC